MRQEELGSWLKQKRRDIEDLLKRRFFYRPSFEIYGGVSGFYDYGPPGCAIKRELEALWRDHFVLEEDMLEISASNITPEIVLEASGHIEKFSDFMVKEEGTERCYRADKLLKEVLEERIADPKTPNELREQYSATVILADGLSAAELHNCFTEFKITVPGTDNVPLSYPEPFNLMFSTMIGPAGRLQGFLRPETSQGIFVNFKHLYEYNRGRFPFAVAQLGLGFRNEISPRDGLLRVREFSMAEIEHFVHPDHKDHANFSSLSDLLLPLFSQELQVSGSTSVPISLSEAVDRGVINNQTLAYFMGRTFLFLKMLGIKEEGLRFRQHLPKEMAHYAQDCWDAEVLTSYGWVECVGIADRSCYDLERHSYKSKKNLMAAMKYEEPRSVEVVEMRPVKGKIAAVFKHRTQKVLAALEELPENAKEVARLKVQENEVFELLIDEETVCLSPDMVNPQKTVKKVSQETFYPSVIEPSFGLGRILYAVLEHCYTERQELQEVRSFLLFPPRVAPIKCCILPLSKNADFEPFVTQLKQLARKAKLSSELDDSGSAIGRKYARCDEVGIPFALTIDFQTVQDMTVTLRNARNMEQVRIPVADAVKVIRRLVEGKVTWEGFVVSTYPRFIAESS